MIFLSHNYKDKDVVGPVAVNLAQRYGKDKVFYDSWSIKPGDGIIDKMNKGLENCKYFFFFISQNSLNSGMVSLEWQSALHKSIKDNIKFIPIKIDNSNQPAILVDKLYIDMYNNGLKQAFQHIIDIIDNNDSNIYNSTYSNVYYEINSLSDYEMLLIVKAKKFKEHTPTINISFKNAVDNIEFNVTSSPTQTSFICTSISSSGTIANGNNTKGLKICSQDLTPSEPLYFKIKSKNKENIIDLQIWLTEGKTATLLNQNN